MALKQHGGKRSGAGRPANSGRFPGAALARVQVPQALRQEVLDFATTRFSAEQTATPLTVPGGIYLPQPGPLQTLPLYSSAVRAGFPSPAEDHVAGYLDLNQLLVHDPDMTFMVRVEGDSMSGAGIDHGDILVVSRALEAQNGDIVVAVIDNEFTVKRLKRERAKAWLVPENPAYPEVDLSRVESAQIWGVVTGAVKRFRGAPATPKKE